MNDVTAAGQGVLRMFESLEPRLMLSAGAVQQAVQLFNASPALFVRNQGQWADSAIRYGFDGAGCGIAFRDSELDFLLYRGQGNSAASQPSETGSPQATASAESAGDSANFSISFGGANVVTPIGQDLARTAFNYFTGNQANWRSNVPAYSEVAYPSIYDGIDLKTYGQRTGLQYEFDAAPGADYRQIQVRYDGVAGLSIAADGSLHIQTALGDVVEQAPHIYQVINGQQVAVAGQFQLLDANTYSFALTGK